MIFSNNVFWRSVLLFVLVVAQGTHVSAQETIFRHVPRDQPDSSVELVSMFSRSPAHGFLPVKVDLSNDSSEVQQISLSFTHSKGDFDAQSLRSASNFNFRIEPKSRTSHEFLVPLKPWLESYRSAQLAVKLSGSMGEMEALFEGMEDAEKMPCIAMSEALYTPNVGKLTEEMKAQLSRVSYSGGDEFASKFSPNLLPSQWQGWIGFDVVMLRDVDWLAMESTSRLMLEKWLRLGGHLIVYHQAGATPEAIQIPADSSFGKVSWLPLPDDALLDSAKTLEFVQKEHSAPKTLSSSLAIDYQLDWPLYAQFGKKSFHYGLIISILGIFAILIGPINVFLLAKTGQRSRLVYTTPLISLVFSVLLGVIFIGMDGIGGHGSRKVLMEIRPEAGEHEAFIHQEQFCRTGLLTKSSFKMNSAIISPTIIPNSGWARFTQTATTGEYNLLLDHDRATAVGDWFSSRSEHGHLITAVQPTRSTISRSNMPLTFLSTFNFPLQWILLHEGGKFYLAENIKTGIPFQVKEINPETYHKKMKLTAEEMNQRHREMIYRLANRNNAFVAVSGEAPGIETLSQIDWKSTQTILTGRLAAAQ